MPLMATEALDSQVTCTCIALATDIHTRPKSSRLTLTGSHAYNTPCVQAPPSWETLKIVALQRAVPFMGFGFMDNGAYARVDPHTIYLHAHSLLTHSCTAMRTTAIMILAGDYIEMSIGATFGISTMAVRPGIHMCT